MRKTKSEGKTVGISQSVRKVANFAMHLRNWQGCCNFAMRNFAKDFDVFCETNEQCIVVFEFRNANFAMPISQCQMVANCLPKFLFCFFSSDFQYMLQNLHKTSKIKARKIAEE